MTQKRWRKNKCFLLYWFPPSLSFFFFPHLKKMSDLPTAEATALPVSNVTERLHNLAIAAPESDSDPIESSVIAAGGEEESSSTVTESPTSPREKDEEGEDGAIETLSLEEVDFEAEPFQTTEDKGKAVVQQEGEEDDDLEPGTNVRKQDLRWILEKLQENQAEEKAAKESAAATANNPTSDATAAIGGGEERKEEVEVTKKSPQEVLDLLGIAATFFWVNPLARDKEAALLGKDHLPPHAHNIMLPATGFKNPKFEIEALDYALRHWPWLRGSMFTMRKEVISTITDLFIELGEIGGNPITHIDMANENNASVTQNDPRQMINHALFATGQLEASKEKLLELARDNDKVAMLTGFSLLFGVVEAIDFAWSAGVEARNWNIQEFDEHGKAIPKLVSVKGRHFTDKNGLGLRYVSGDKTDTCKLGHVSVLHQDITLIASLAHQLKKLSPAAAESPEVLEQLFRTVFAEPLPEPRKHFAYEGKHELLWEKIYAKSYGRAYFAYLAEVHARAAKVFGVELVPL